MENDIAGFYDLIDSGFYNTAEARGARELGDYEADPAWLWRKLKFYKWGAVDTHFDQKDPRHSPCRCLSCNTVFHVIGRCPFCGSASVERIADA